MRTALLVVAGLAALLIAYGSLIEPRFLLDQPHHEVEVAGLPAGWDGQRIALFADLQIGMWFDNPGMAEKAVARAINDDVDLVLIAGDFVYAPDSSTVREAVDLVRPLSGAGIPTLAVLGNHDYSLMKEHSDERPPIAEYLEAQLRQAGVTVLRNETVPMTAGGDTLWVAGIGSVWAEDANVEETHASIPAGAPRIWLMHNPTAFRGIPAGEAPLALAAHTHGGQVRILSGPRNSWLDIVREGEVVADGWAADSIGAPGNRLYVNRGLGFSGVPIRIFCRPELTVLTLRAAT